jgi:hypothetical protein
MLERLPLMLLEAGILSIAPAHQFNPSDYTGVVSSTSTPLSEPDDRIQYYRSKLALLRSQLPELSESGLCGACQNVTVSNLRAAEGFAHSDSWWHLLASADQCPSCKLMVAALRRQAPVGDLDRDMYLSPPGNPYQVVLLASIKKRRYSPLDDPVDMEAITVLLRNAPTFAPGVLSWSNYPGNVVKSLLDAMAC